MSELNKLKNCVKYPTSIIVRGDDLLGIELAKSLLEQGGFVILIDNLVSAVEKYLPLIEAYEQNLLILDYSGLVNLNQELRRLDYVFYLNHQAVDFSQKISTQEFLQASNYLDSVLDLTARFDAKFLLSTSVKAHQLIVADKVIDLNYAVDTEERYAVYSELEIQRYAESLVREYQEKVGVNARVVRLGTLLGKGMEINLESGLINMCLEALLGKRITVPGDGLESDHFIHYLDAAYGIIKAQFSPNTRGKIYTLANEEEVTLLSIAYKLIELVPKAGEIRFDPADHSLPPLKLYKPAPNLQAIGWKPRVPLERALKQTLEFLEHRIYEAGGDLEALDRELIPINAAEPREELSFKDKLLDFFFIAEQEAKASQAEVNANAAQLAELSTEGALARLIAERRNQERARRGNIILANNELRASIQPKPKKNLLQRMDDGIALWLFDLKRRFDFFKNMSVLDFVFLVLGVTVFLTVYFTMLAPLVSLSKNLFFVERNLQAMQKELDDRDLAAAAQYNDHIITDLKEAQDRVGELEFLFNTIDKKELYRELRLLLSNSSQFFNGMDTIYKGLLPWQQYVSEFEPDFMRRLDTATYVSVDGSKSYPSVSTLTSSGTSAMALSISSNKTLLPVIEESLKNMPFSIYETLAPSLEGLSSELASLEQVKVLTNYAPVLLGIDGSRQYLVLIQDELRYTAGGGEFAGYILFTVKDGSVKAVRMENWSKLAPVIANYESTALEELKLSASRIVTSENGTLADASLMGSSEIMLKVLEDYLRVQSKSEIDMTVSINLTTLEDLIGPEGIDTQQGRLERGGLSNYLASSLANSSSAAERNDLILDLTAAILEQRFNELDTYLPLVAETVSEGVASGQIRYLTSNLALKKMLSESTSLKEDMDLILLGANYDQESTNVFSTPALTLSGKVIIKNDGTSLKQLTMSGSNFKALQNLLYCTPYGSKELNATSVAPELVSQALSYVNDRSCLLLLPGSELRYVISYTSPAYEAVVDGSTPYKLELDIAPGIEVNYDLEFVFENGIKDITPVTEGFTRQSNGFLYRGTDSGSNVFIFERN